MLGKLYRKSKLLFAIGWIAVYCVLMSLGDAISVQIGIEKSVTVAVGGLLSFLLFWFLRQNRLLQSYGLCAPKIPARETLYYVPLLLMLSANLWFGVTVHYGAVETVLYILAMFCVGFLEEVIFRGLLFRAMLQENPRAAVIVSGVTFGVGHIINLINGSGAELLPNLLQVLYATAAGFMFVMLYCKTHSLVGCIAAHGMFNAISVFAVEPPTLGLHIFSCMGLALICSLYALYLAKGIRINGSEDATQEI